MDFSIETFVNEAYVGKTRTLFELEKAIGKLRAVVTQSTPNNCKEVLAINRLVEKQFGMHLFALYLDPTQQFNAYTYTIGGFYDYSLNEPWKYVTGDPTNGYRFTRDNKFTVVTHISYGLLNDKKYTDAEVTGILLHEIGHNFGDCIYDVLYLYNRKLVEQYRRALISSIWFSVLLAPFTMGTTLVLTAAFAKRLNDFTKGGEKITKKAKKDRKHTRRVAKFFESLKFRHSDRADANSSLRFRRMPDAKDRLDATYNTYSDEYKSAIRSSEDRQAEVFADKFAGVYGYGFELSSALAKSTKISDDFYYKSARREAHGDPFYQKLNDDISEALLKFNDLDCHPDLIQRINSNIDLLKKEYEKSTIDPAVKKELLMQMNDMQKLIDDLTDAQNKIYHIDKAQALYNQKINDQLPSAVDKEIEDKIDEVLDKALEKGEKRYK